MNSKNKKIILITGATSGIGKEAALALAKEGHHIIIHGRNLEKTHKTQAEIKAQSGNSDIDTLIADLFSLAEVKALATEFRSKYDHLDVLINNAGGIMNKDRELTKEGLEKTMTINLFAPFLLTHLLLKPMKASADARVINISSYAHNVLQKPNLQDIEQANNYEVFGAYGNAKLFLIWITRHFAALFKQEHLDSITINSLHPGMVASSFGTNSKLGIASFLLKMARPFFISPQKGAQTMVYLAISEKVKTISGDYFVKKKPARANDKYYSKENEQIVWDYCLKVTQQYLEGDTIK